jgi:hypothetical protein
MRPSRPWIDQRGPAVNRTTLGLALIDLLLVVLLAGLLFAFYH